MNEGRGKGEGSWKVSLKAVSNNVSTLRPSRAGCFPVNTLAFASTKHRTPKWGPYLPAPPTNLSLLPWKLSGVR